MSNITYPAKTVAGNGGTEYVEGQSLPAAELQADFDAIANVVNGDLDEDNLAGGTQIPNSKLAEIAPSKVGDYSASASQAATVTTPGDSATLSSNLATDLSDELERLRYRIEALAGYRSGTVYRNNAGSNVGTAWVEPPIRGNNLLRNAGFEVFTGSSGDPPDEWSETGTLASTAIENPANPITGLEKRSLAITTDAASEGISQTVGGIRADTKYLVGFKYFRTSGTLSFSVTGALSTGNYQNIVVTDSSSTGVQVASMVVQSSSAGADITVAVTETSGSGDFNLVQAWMFELNDDWPNPLPDIPSQSLSVSSEVTNVPATVASGTDWDTQWTDIPGLALSQYIPAAGYRLIYEVSISWATVIDDQQAFFAFRLELDDGSTSVVDGPFIESFDQVGFGELNKASVTRLTHIVERPTPGTTYTFTPQATAADSAGAAANAPRLHPLIAITQGGAASAGSNSAIQTVSTSRLKVERI